MVLGSSKMSLLTLLSCRGCSTFSSSHLMVSGHRSRSLIHFRLIFLGKRSKVEVLFYTSTHVDSIFSSPFVERLSFLPGLILICWSKISCRCVAVFLGFLFYLLIFMSVFMPAPLMSTTAYGVSRSLVWLCL